MNKYLTRIICAFIPSKKLRKKFRENFRNFKIDIAIGNNSSHEFHTKDAGTSVVIDGYSYYDLNVEIFDANTKIGKFTSIAKNVKIGIGSHDANFLSTSPFIYGNGGGVGFKTFKPKNITESKISNIVNSLQKPVTIGNDVYIGMNALLKAGITIGDGAIVGMGAVVTKDVPPYAIVVGVPAKVIRYRFSEEMIKDLLELKWWDLDEDTISNLSFFNVETAIKELKEIRGREKKHE